VIASQTTPASSIEPYESKAQAQKKLVEELKVQWKLLWSQRFDDKKLAEGVSVNDYSILHVERGTIIHATRNFKALSFKEILEQHLVENPDRYIPPATSVGGWNKFIQKEITSQSRQKRGGRTAAYISEKPGKSASQQPKKGGRGWLHAI
jgi:hypothetical protein